MASVFRKKSLLLVAVPVTLLAAAGIGLAVNGSSQSYAEASAAQPVTKQFGVFANGEAQVSQGSLSDTAGRWLESIQAGQRTRLAAEAARAQGGGSLDSSANAGGGEPSVTALAETEGSDGSTVVVAAVGDEEICAFDEGSELGTCAPTTLAATGHAFSAAPAGCDAYNVIGVMPDGVSSLTVTPGDSKVIPVTSNVYEATLSAKKTTLTSQNPPMEVVLPLDEYAKLNPAC